VPAEGFRLLTEPEKVLAFRVSESGARRFCARCGSPLPTPPIDGRVFVPLGSLEDDVSVELLAHVFVGSKATWDVIADALPQFDTWPPGFEGPVLPDRPAAARPDGPAGGSCQCDGVAYELTGPVRAFYHCHCRRCRWARGAAYATNLFVDVADFRWIRGAEGVRTYKVPEAERFTQAFCGTCGAKVPRVNEARGTVVVPAGSLDGDPGSRPTAHIFVGSKAPWDTIADDLPQHPTTAI